MDRNDGPKDADRLESLVARTLELMEDEGSIALDRICRENPELAIDLRRRIDRMRDMGLAGTVAAPGGPQGGPLGGTVYREGGEIGGYVLRRRLGRGGMGEVWLADQCEPVQRQVALKLIRTGFESAQYAARFAHERLLLARMNHDGIARVYDAGSTEDGNLYFAMEYVPGSTLTNYCDEVGMPLGDRMELLAQVCDAVQHSHQNGVIHRDLKPSNVLVVERDGEARAKVIDFGLAKLTEVSDLQSMQTRSGQLLGTLEYMSPEQARASGEAVDTRSDVYSLGVMAYELFVGAHPLGFDLPATDRDPVVRLAAICETEPMRPAAALRKHWAAQERAAARGFRRTQDLVRACSGDLERILRACLSKDPERRYRSAAALGEDLRRCRNNQTLLLEPPSVGYVLRCFLARNRTLARASAVVAAAVLVALFLVFRFAAGEAKALARFDELVRIEEHGAIQGDLGALLGSVVPGGTPHPADVRGILGRFDHARRRLGEFRASAPGAAATDRDRRIRTALARLEAGFARPEFLREIEVARRVLPWAGDVEAATLIAPADAWAEAVAAIEASVVYGGLAIEPQLGLVPIGPNDRGYWEFRVWTPEGEAPPGGDAAVSDAMDPVVVLVPGGPARVGVQADDPAAPRYVESVRPSDAGCIEAEIPPFFVGKHELTQGQWRRFSGVDESAVEALVDEGGEAAVGAFEALPVNGVGRDRCASVLAAYGLQLPTEMQWEFAARVGDDRPWPVAIADLGTVGNLADASARAEGRAMEGYEAFDDGFSSLAPVGSFAPNGFGLHDTLGNVWEAVRDDYAEGLARARAGDAAGFLVTGIRQYCIYRGGGYGSRASAATFHSRLGRPASGINSIGGCRIARPVVRSVRR